MADRKSLPRAAALRALFEYRSDGTLVSKHDRLGTSLKKGRKVGTLDKGYLWVKIGQQRLAVHRIVYKMHHDEEHEFIDHINRDKQDNRIENLRPITRQGNKANTDPKGEYKGVISTASGRFRAQITLDGATKYLGTFDTAEEAAEMYDQHASFHFGEHARLNFDD